MTTSLRRHFQLSSIIAPQVILNHSKTVSQLKLSSDDNMGTSLCVQHLMRMLQNKLSWVFLNEAFLSGFWCYYQAITVFFWVSQKIMRLLSSFKLCHELNFLLKRNRTKINANYICKNLFLSMFSPCKIPKQRTVLWWGYSYHSLSSVQPQKAHCAVLKQTTKKGAPNLWNLIVKKCRRDIPCSTTCKIHEILMMNEFFVLF